MKESLNTQFQTKILSTEVAVTFLLMEIVFSLEYYYGIFNYESEVFYSR